MFFSSIIILPPKLHVSIIKKKNCVWIWIYSPFYNYKYSLDNVTKLFWNAELNALQIRLTTHTLFFKMYQCEIKRFLFSLNFYFFTKFKLKGKGFRIYRHVKRKLMRFYFGHSHFQILKIFNTRLKKIAKYKLFLENNSFMGVKNIISHMRTIKPLNLFTKRGLKECRRFVYKRKGKSKIF